MWLGNTYLRHQKLDCSTQEVKNLKISSLLSPIIKGEVVFGQCLLMKIAKSKRELLAETKGTVVGEMLVDQAISTWLQLYYHEDREATSPAENMQIGEYRLKKIESAFNRHMRSLSALTALKAVQFSQKMVNAMAATTSDDGSNPAAALSATSRIKTNGNRLTNAFGGAFEPISMN